MRFVPGKFGVDMDAGVDGLWVELTKPDAITGMIQASDNVRPAIEAVRERLLRKFPEAFDPDNPKQSRNKQLAGFMVRQIMEAHGYELVSKNERVDRFPFSRAALYRKKGAFEFYVFRSSGDARHICISTKRSKSALPQPPSKDWVFWTVVDSKLQVAVALGIMDTEKLISEVTAKGFVTLQMSRTSPRGYSRRIQC